MKKSLFCKTVALLALVILVTPATSQETNLEVASAVICKEVTSLEPIGPDISFPASIGRLCCFSRIVGASTPTTVTHVWYSGPTQRARVPLAVKGPDWRTYSSKIIQPHEIGSWRVEILDAEDTVLKVLQFITTAEERVASPGLVETVEPTQKAPPPKPQTEAPAERPVD